MINPESSFGANSKKKILFCSTTVGKNLLKYDKLKKKKQKKKYFDREKTNTQNTFLCLKKKKFL